MQEDESVDREANRPGHPGCPQDQAPMISLRQKHTHVIRTSVLLQETLTKIPN